MTAQMAWKANRPWAAAGFLASTSLFLLLFLNWQSQLRGIEESAGTGLSSIASPAPTWFWKSRSVLPSYTVARPSRGPATNHADRRVVRTGELEITVADPLRAADQLRAVASELSGFVVSSKVSGQDEQMQSAEVTLRIPAGHFDEARARAKAVAASVEEDTVEARDVTSDYVDQEAVLRNTRAEEQQYLLVLKRTASVGDVLEVTAKLAEVRARVDKQQAELNSLHGQVEMSVLTTRITALADVRVFGIRWRPLYKAKLAFRGALTALAGYGDFLVGLLVNLPVILVWCFTIVALLKAGWLVLVRIVLLFFPALRAWRRRPVPAA